MSYKVDQRGSKDQRILYDFIFELYPGHRIVYEFPLHGLNQRVDIYLPNLGIAIEYHGRQHYEFVKHFHKDLEGFKKAKEQDQQKLEYLLLRGVKFIEIPYNQMVTSKEELAKIIDETPYPETDYKVIDKTSESRNDYLKNQREYRKDVYQKIKKTITIDEDKHKERLELQRQQRKEAYKKYKESKLKK